MSESKLLQQLNDAPESVEFTDVINVIEHWYEYSPTTFTNGLGDNTVTNEAGSNEGSCKIFAFALLHKLSPEATLACFGKYYREDVLQHPNNTDHANIRQFIKDGWAGIHFTADALTAKHQSI